MRSALVDSSAFVSLVDPDEPSHPRCRATLNRLLDGGVLLATTNFIFDETYTTLLSRAGRRIAVEWGERLRAGKLVHVHAVEPHQEERAWAIILGYEDKDFSFTDATSFAVIEDLAIDGAFSLDHHFHQYGGFEVVPGQNPP